MDIYFPFTKEEFMDLYKKCSYGQFQKILSQKLDSVKQEEKEKKAKEKQDNLAKKLREKNDD